MYIARIKNYIPIASEVVVGPEHTFAMRVHALRANADGTCYARLRGDAEDAWRTYTLTAGSFAYGDFAAVRPAAFAAGALLGLQFPTE
jgi:hypothetical protein